MCDKAISAFSMYCRRANKKNKPATRKITKKSENVAAKRLKRKLKNSIDTSIQIKSKPKVKNTEIVRTKRKNTKEATRSLKTPPVKHNRPLEVFDWLIAPLTSSNFFETYWEKQPLFIKRNRGNYYNTILTTAKLDGILRENSLHYTRNVDVVSYVDGKRETHNPDGRVIPAVLWDYYNTGCSIRILNPQTYCHKLHALLATLQEFFGCMVGVNAYLTPPNSQGFAPHYDDIEAFVLQLEGRKHWKLYSPLSKSQVLPRFSSKNLERSELKAPIKTITLEAGDVLYFPRGVIHEGTTDRDSHSLHVTVSVYQRTAYVDLLEHILKPALTSAAAEDIEFREGLPLQYLQHVGWVNENKRSETRVEIINKVEKLLGKLKQYVLVDSAADQMGRQFMWDSMPPLPRREEKQLMVHEDGEKMMNGMVFNKGEISLDLKVRLLRYHCLRIAKCEEHEGTFNIYYSVDNAKYYHGEQEQMLSIGEDLAPAVKCLINNYPQYIHVKLLPLERDEDKMQLVADLWEIGLLVTERPLVM